MDSTEQPTTLQNASESNVALSNSLFESPDSNETLTKQAIQTDVWNQIQEAYLRGTPISEIASQHGVTVNAIRCRAWRQRWRDSVANDSLSEPLNLDHLTKEWKLNMSLSLLDRSRWWANQDISPKDAGEAKTWDAALSLSVETGRKLLGLDQGQQQGPSWMAGKPVIDV